MSRFHIAHNENAITETTDEIPKAGPPNGKVTYLIDGLEAFEVFYDKIVSARKSIFINMWYIQNETKMLIEEKDVDFVELLRMRAKKGKKSKDLA